MASKEAEPAGSAGEKREDDPLFILTRGDVQTVAVEELGHELTEAEIGAVMDNFRKAFNWEFYIENSIQAAQEWGKVEAAGLGEQPAVAAKETELLKEFLVYYSLSGLMPVRATGQHEASDKVFASLHVLVGNLATHGLTAEEATRVRLHEAEIEIDAIETIQPSEDGGD